MTEKILSQRWKLSKHAFYGIEPVMANIQSKIVDMFQAGGKRVKAGASVKIRVDPEGKIRSCNIYGDTKHHFDPCDLTGLNVGRTMAEGEAESLIRLIRHTIMTGQPTLHIHQYMPGPDESHLRKIVIRPGVIGGDDAVLLVYPYP